MAALALEEFDGTLSLGQSLENVPLKLTVVIEVVSAELARQERTSAASKAAAK